MQHTKSPTEVHATSRIKPMIYVASLSDYNAGRLIGRWFDLSDYPDADDLLAHISDWLENLGQTDGIQREEWAIHDLERLEHMGEHPSKSFLDEYIQAIHDGVDLDALEKYVGASGYPSDFRDHYVGAFDSISDFADRLVEASGHLDDVPDYLRPYIDVEAYGRDALLGDYFEVDGFYFRRS